MGGPAPSALNMASVGRIPAFRAPAEQERITKAAQEFEGMLMEQLMQGMRKTVEPSGLFGKEDQSRSTFDYLLDQAVIAKAVKGGKGLGLAAQMERIWASRSPLPAAAENIPHLGKTKALPIGLESR